MTSWASTQQRRLKELGAIEEQLRFSFRTSQERDRAYQELEKLLVDLGKQRPYR